MKSGNGLSEQETAEVLAEVGGRFRNIEDWDFRDPSLPVKDPVANAFLTMHYTDVVATEMVRTAWLESLQRQGIGQVSDDGEYLVIPPTEMSWEQTEPGRRRGLTGPVKTRGFMEGFLKAGLLERITDPGGRWERKVRQSMLKEWEKTGRLKLRIRADRYYPNA